MCFSSKNGINFQIQFFYDVIIGNMEGLVTSLFFKVERQNLGNWGILVFFLNNYLFSKFNRCILERPFNFAIFEERSPKFCKLYHFDVFSQKTTLISMTS